MSDAMAVMGFAWVTLATVVVWRLANLLKALHERVEWIELRQRAWSATPLFDQDDRP